MYDKSTGNGYPMTEENCNTEPWNTDKSYDRPENFIEKITALFKSIANWLKEFVAFISETVKEKVG